MKSTAPSQKSRIRILQNGPSKGDYAIAADLIREGLAKGDVVYNKTGQGESVHALHWGGLSERGREYLDSLKSRKRAVLYGLLGLVSTFIGWLVKTFHDEIFLFIGL